MKQILGGFEDIGEAAHELGQAAVSQTKKQAQNAANTATSQITGNPIAQNPNGPKTQSGTNEQSSPSSQQMSDDQAKQFLKDLYGPSGPQDKLPPASTSNQAATAPQPQSVVAQAIGLPQENPNKGKTPEEVAKMESLRRQLHADYYASLTRPVPPEEHVTEKLEREEQEEQMAALEEDKEKPQDLPQGVKQGTGEMVPGVSG